MRNFEDWVLYRIIQIIFIFWLCAGSDDSVDAGVEFDFLLDGEFLRVPLDKHLENRGVSSVSYVSCKSISSFFLYVWLSVCITCIIIQG